MKKILYLIMLSFFLVGMSLTSSYAQGSSEKKTSNHAQVAVKYNSGNSDKNKNENYKNRGASKYRDAFTKRLGNVFFKTKLQKLKNIVAEIDRMIAKVEANDDMDETRKERLLAQLYALKYILEEILDGREHPGDNKSPVIVIKDNVAAGPVASDTVRAKITDDNIFVREYALSSDATCNASDFPGTTYVNDTNIVFNTEANNGKYVCFKGQDNVGNTSYAISANDLNIDVDGTGDTTSPVITIVDNVAVGPVASDTVRATITDTNISLREYALSADYNCNASDFPGTAYTNDTNLVFNTEANNGKYVCFKGADTSGNITYGVSAYDLNIDEDIEEDTTNPVITINNDVAAGPIVSDTVRATITDTNISLREYALSSDATCNASDFPGTTYANATNLVFNTTANNGKYVCFKGADTNGNVAYAVSANDLNIYSDDDGPNLVQVTAVASPTNDTTPDYTFNSNEAGSIAYSGDCSSSTTAAVNGDNTVTFNTLSAGTHSNCKISVTDGDGNISALLSVNSFTIDVTGPTMTINNDVAAGPVASDTINVAVSDTSGVASRSYGFSADNVCNASDTYANLFVSATDFMIATEANNGNYVCFKAIDNAGNTSYLTSSNALNIDTTP